MITTINSEKNIRILKLNHAPSTYLISLLQAPKVILDTSISDDSNMFIKYALQPTCSDKDLTDCLINGVDFIFKTNSEVKGAYLFGTHNYIIEKIMNENGFKKNDQGLLYKDNGYMVESGKRVK